MQVWLLIRNPLTQLNILVDLSGKNHMIISKESEKPFTKFNNVFLTETLEKTDAAGMHRTCLQRRGRPGPAEERVVSLGKCELQTIAALLKGRSWLDPAGGHSEAVLHVL